MQGARACRDTKTGDVPRHWRWRGFLADYYTAECDAVLEDAPALLMVHGFGAFGEQWRGQIKALTAAGYQAGLVSLSFFLRTPQIPCPSRR